MPKPMTESIYYIEKIWLNIWMVVVIFIDITAIIGIKMIIYDASIILDYGLISILTSIYQFFSDLLTLVFCSVVFLDFYKYNLIYLVGDKFTHGTPTLSEKILNGIVRIC